MKHLILIIATLFNLSLIAQVKPVNTVIIPKQAGNAGKFLKTNGSQLSWDTPAGGGGGSSTFSEVLQNGNEILNNQIIYRNLSDTTVSLELNPTNGIFATYYNSTDSKEGGINMYQSGNYFYFGDPTLGIYSELSLNVDSSYINTPKLNYNNFEVLNKDNLKTYRLSSNTINATTVTVNIFTVTLQPNTEYNFSGVIKTSAVASDGIKIYYSNSSSNSFLLASGNNTSVGTYLSDLIVLSGYTIPLNKATGASFINISGYLENSTGSPIDIYFGFAAGTSGTKTVFKGSYINLYK
jgi:hypothetical protein